MTLLICNVHSRLCWGDRALKVHWRRGLSNGSIWKERGSPRTCSTSIKLEHCGAQNQLKSTICWGTWMQHLPRCEFCRPKRPQSYFWPVAAPSRTERRVFGLWRLGLEMCPRQSAPQEWSDQPQSIHTAAIGFPIKNQSV